MRLMDEYHDSRVHLRNHPRRLEQVAAPHLCVWQRLLYVSQGCIDKGGAITAPTYLLRACFSIRYSRP